MTEPDVEAVRACAELAQLEGLLRDGRAALDAAFARALAGLGATGEVSLDGVAIDRGVLEGIQAALELDRAHLELHPEDVCACLSSQHALRALVARWQAARPDGGALQVLRGVDGEPDVVAWSPDGRRLAVADYAGLRVWDLERGEPCDAVDAEDMGELRGLAWSPDQASLVYGGRDHSVRWADLGAAAPRWEAGGHEGQVTSASFAPDGQRVAVGNLGWTARVYDAQGAEQVRYEGHRQSVLAIAFAPDGTAVASAGSDGTVQVWSAEDGARLALLGDADAVEAVASAPPEASAMGAVVESLAYRSDGARLAACFGREVRVWRVGDWSEVARFELEGGAGPLAWIGPSRLGVAGFQSVEVFDAETGARVAREGFDPRRARALPGAFAADGRLALALDVGTLRVWRPAR